ncbi:MAG: PEP-CTERM sorting domain-containing protein [Acidobacteriia bacterium]|nr:PEP-CTERM sorting domain-containing protein [Terriglobia bacterium]
MRKIGVLLAILVAAGAFNAPAFASTIGPSCGSCNGASYTLSYSYVSQGGSTDVVNVTLSINTSTMTAATLGMTPVQFASAGPIHLDNVAIKINSSILSSTLIQAPVGNWSLMPGGLNAGGCSGSGAGWSCALSATVGGAPVIGSGTPLVWVFHLTIPHGSLATALNGASIKARYVDKHGNKVGSLLSENITDSQHLPPPQVPEPGTMVLFGSGLLGLATVVRGRLRL